MYRFIVALVFCFVQSAMLSPAKSIADTEVEEIIVENCIIIEVNCGIFEEEDDAFVIIECEKGEYNNNAKRLNALDRVKIVKVEDEE
jgi:hypothetical protein